MHIILEGTLPLEVKLMLTSFIKDKKYFDMWQVRVENEHYSILVKLNFFAWYLRNFLCRPEVLAISDALTIDYALLLATRFTTSSNYGVVH